MLKKLKSIASLVFESLEAWYSFFIVFLAVVVIGSAIILGWFAILFAELVLLSSALPYIIADKYREFRAVLKLKIRMIKQEILRRYL